MNHDASNQLFRRLLLLLIPAIALSTGAAGEDTYRYEGRITGLFCHACAGKVRASLGKLAGVRSVKITRSEQDGVQGILVQSTDPSLTKEMAIEALGEDTASFTILEFGRTP